MKAIAQHVKDCGVKVDDNLISYIDLGLLCYIGIKNQDSQKDIDYLVDKILNLRIIEDENQKMNLSVINTNQSLMIVSQFTLYADIKRGRRPSFNSCMPPQLAEAFFDDFVNQIKQRYQNVQTGKFQSFMNVSYTNLGPKTFIIES